MNIRQKSIQKQRAYTKKFNHTHTHTLPCMRLSLASSMGMLMNSPGWDDGKNSSMPNRFLACA